MNESLIAPLNRYENSDMGDGTYCCDGVVRPHPCVRLVTVVIPHIGSAAVLRRVVELHKLQTVEPNIVVIDTGSREGDRYELERLRCYNVEIHYIRSHAWMNYADTVGAANDIGVALCKTPYIFFTHNDCLPVRRDLLQYYLTLCQEDSVVGYRMADRSHATDEWINMVGHMALMVDMRKVFWTHNVHWSMTKYLEFTKTHRYQEILKGWPDTETSFNKALQLNGIKPKFIGQETAFDRQTDENIDHVRNLSGSHVFHSFEEHAKRGAVALVAMSAADNRIKEWSANGNSQKE